MRKLGVLALAGALLASEAAACEESTAQAVTSARAKANLTSLFSDQDYPASAVAAREQGEVAFTLDVGANGRVTACTVTRSSGSTALDDTTCRLLRSRARFTPALDAAGGTVSDHLAGRIVWRLPPPPPAPAP
ncbi:MAG: energy transducer TonB [Allosphingosinicella sp.]